MKKPWYKSLKKWLGIIFSLAVLIGGIIDIYKHPENTIAILRLWANMSLIFLGLTGALGIGHKVIETKKDKPEWYI